MGWLSSTEALTLVKAQVAYDVAPELDDAEISAILTRTARASVWAASTAYAYGTRVVPTARTGYVFTAAKAGTSGASEPDWPEIYGGGGLYPVTWPHTHAFSTGLTDGTVEWVATSPDFGDIWDTERAVYECWLLKASKATAQYDVSADGTSLRREQVYDHCMQMARRYQPVAVA